MPSKSTLLVMLVLTLLAVLLGYNYYFKPFAYLAAEQTEPLPSPGPEPESTLLVTANLTPEEKIALLLALPVTITDDSLDASSSAWLAQTQPGFVTLFGTRVSTTSAQAVIAEIKAAAQPTDLPISIVVDHEGGTAQRLNGPGFTALPAWQSLCAQPATVSAQLVSRSAQELRQAGVNVVLAPVLDLGSGHPALGSRLCSNDPDVIEGRATQFISAMSEQQVFPVIKHFPGLGQTRYDLHRQFDSVMVDPIEAGIYTRLLDIFPRLGVMVSHVGVENQYPDLPCSLSVDCVGQLTSNYPEALIFSDALEMVAAGHDPEAGQLKSLALRSSEAIMAGNDVLIYGPSVSTTEMSLILASLNQRYQTDQAFAQQVDVHAEKVARWKQIYD